MFGRMFRWFAILLACSGSLSARVAGADKPVSSKTDGLLVDLRAKEVESRRNAMETLRNAERMVQLSSLPVLIDLLMDEKDGQVRLTVFEVITTLGPEAAPAVPALVYTLKTSYGGSEQEESHQDYRAAMALGSIGKPAVEGLRALLGESKAGVRAEAILGLGRVGPEAGPAVPELIGLLGTTEARVGSEASIALSRIGEASIAALLAAATSDKAIVRARAVESLGRMVDHSDRFRQVVLNASHDQSPIVRVAALRSMARLELPSDIVLPTVKESIRHEDPEVRLAAVDLLIQRRVLIFEMVTDLETLLTGPNSEISRVAAFLMGKAGPKAAPQLIIALRDNNSRIDQIAAGLASMGRPVTDILYDALNSQDHRVRRGASLALGQIRPINLGTTERLVAGLEAKEVEVRLDTLTAIEQLGVHAASSLPAVRKSLRDDSPKVRLQTIKVLTQMANRDASVLADMVSLLDDPDPEVQATSIDTIRGFGPLSRDALPQVIGKLKSPNAEVRLAAAEFVKANGPSSSLAVTGLIKLLDDPSPALKTTACQALGMIGKAAQPAFEPLKGLISSDQPKTREAAVLAIGGLSMKAEALRPVFQKALRDDKQEVRRAATRSIQKLGAAGAIFVPDIILMAEKKENQRTVERILRRFESQGPDISSVSELIRQLDHKHEAVRLLAIKFLGLAGEHAKEAIPALEQLHKDPNAEIRKSAEAACKRIKKERTTG